MKLKVCGMKHSENIAALNEIKPDLMGLIFHEKSPRNVEGEFPDEIPEGINKVGVFVNKPEGYILDRIEQYDFLYVQLHGTESSHFCKKIKQLRRKVIKAFNVNEDFDFSVLAKYEPYCEYFLFDAKGEKPGGNGITFSWDLLNKYEGKTPFLLSGGIKPELAEEIKNFNHPQFAGIDINSGFELEPGLKDIEKIKAFKAQL